MQVLGNSSPQSREERKDLLIIFFGDPAYYSGTETPKNIKLQFFSMPITRKPKDFSIWPYPLCMPFLKLVDNLNINVAGLLKNNSRNFL